MSENERLSEKEAGIRIGIAPATLRNWRHWGKGPRYVKYGRKIFYRAKDLDDFVVSSVIDPALPTPRKQRTEARHER